MPTSQGWKWQDEGKNGRHKWGWVSWQPGARLVIKVLPSTRTCSSSPFLMSSHLVSY